jgi:hypothetical protein
MGAPITPRGWMGVDFLFHELFNPKKFKVHIKIFLMRGQKNFEFTGTCFLSCSKKGIFMINKFQILAGLSRTQKKQSSEFNEFSTKT